MNAKRWVGIATAAIAVIACAFTGVFRSQGESVPKEIPLHGSAAATSASPVVDQTLTDRRVQALERRIGELEGRTSSSTAKDTTAPSPAVPTMTNDEKKAQARLEHRQALDDHAREAIDQPWANKASGAIGQSLRAITAGTQASIVNLDCRSKTCSAEVEWRDFQAASRGWKSLLEGDYGQCGVRVMLDDASDPGQPFRTNVLFSCPHVDRSGPPS